MDVEQLKEKDRVGVIQVSCFCVNRISCSIREVAFFPLCLGIKWGGDAGSLFCRRGTEQKFFKQINCPEENIC